MVLLVRSLDWVVFHHHANFFSHMVHSLRSLWTVSGVWSWRKSLGIFCASYDLDGSAQDGNFFLLDSAGYCQAVVFNALMVFSLLAEDVDFSIQACYTNICEKLVGSIPPIYLLCDPRTNKHTHTCLSGMPSLGLTGMNEARSLHVLFPKGLAFALALSLSLARSLTRPLFPFAAGRQSCDSRPLISIHPSVLHPLPCRFRIEEAFQ